MKPISIILVDDHTLVRAGIRVLVQKIPGVQVVAEASDGEMALQFIEKHKPNLVFLDIEMPGANGLEVTTQIAQTWPDTRVIILSMHGEQEYVLRALRAGAKGYLSLNFNAVGTNYPAIQDILKHVIGKDSQTPKEKVGENLFELRHDGHHQEGQNRHCHGDNNDGIYHGGDDLVLDLLRLLLKICQTGERHVQHAAGLARANHVDVKPVEDLWVLRQRFAECTAAFNGLGKLNQSSLQYGILLLPA